MKYQEVAITKQGWDNLSPSQQKKYAKEHPTSMFSRALNLVLLKNKAREIRADIRDLKVQLSKRISKAKKLVVEKSLKTKKSRLEKINEEIRVLQKLLEKHNKPVSTKPVDKPIVLTKPVEPKPVKTVKKEVEKKSVPIKLKMDYITAPLPKEKDYLTNKWIKARKNVELRLAKADELDKLREKIRSYCYPNFAPEELKQQYYNLSDELDALNRDKKPSEYKYIRYDSYIKNNEDTIRKDRATLFNYLDGVLEGKYSPSEYNKVKGIVQDLLYYMGPDYVVALVNTNKDYPKYWNHLIDHPEDRNKIAPILTLFDDEQIEDENDIFNSVEEQNKYLRTLSPKVHINSIRDKKFICQTFKELEDKYIPFKIWEIKTTGQRVSNARIGNQVLSLQADYFNSVQVGDASKRQEDFKKYIERQEKFVKDDMERLDVARSTGQLIDAQLKRLKQDEKFLNLYKDQIKYKWWTFCPDGVLRQKSTLTHEYGHYIYNIASRKHYDRVWQYVGHTYREVLDSEDKYLLSEYAMSNDKEFFAECFCMYNFGHPLPSHIKLMVESTIELAKDAYPDYGYLFEGITG